VNELGVQPLPPSSAEQESSSGKNAHGNRDGRPFLIEYPLPQYSQRDGRQRVVRVCQQVIVCVVEDVVARESLVFSRQDP